MLRDLLCIGKAQESEQLAAVIMWRYLMLREEKRQQWCLCIKYMYCESISRGLNIKLLIKQKETSHRAVLHHLCF